MKKFILVAVVALFGFTMNAQDGEFKVGINGALPVGDAGDFADFSLGVDLTYLIPVSDEFYLGATV